MRDFEKVIFDTNTLRNTEPKNFLGGREELQKFSKVAEIIFPDIVIEELKYQKRKNLERHKKSFLENPFHWLKNLNQEETQSFDNEAHIEDLEVKEEIRYSVIKLSNYSVLEKMKELALKKQPPFEEADNTDKGFKDAYIYFTILEYLQTIPDKYVFVCTKDGRLKMALEKHPNIKVVVGFEEFRKESISSFYDEYFIEKIQEVINLKITEKNITGFWVNINKNQVLLVELNDEKFVIEVDSGEIINNINRNEYADHLDDFIKSGAFASTHRAIADLESYKNYFSDGDIVNIMQAAIENGQISSIIDDDDVRQFIGDLFVAKKDILERELRESLEQLLYKGLNHD